MYLSERLFTSPSSHTDSLIERLQQKRNLIKAGDPRHAGIRTALIIGAGAMRGVYSGGVAIGLEELDMTEVFDNVVGISSGASTAAYFLSRQAALGTSIYYEELANKEFIDFKRFKNILNIGYLGMVFAEIKPLNQRAVFESRSRLHIGLTNAETALPEYREALQDSDADIIKLIQASSSVPGLTPPSEISGTRYIDGIISCKNPIQYAIESLGATDIFCVANQPLRERVSAPIIDHFVSALLTRGHNRTVKRAYRNRQTMSDDTLSVAYDSNIHIGVLCPESDPIGLLTSDARKLARVALQAKLQTKEVFGNY